MTAPDLTIAIPTADRMDLCHQALDSIRQFEQSSGLLIDIIVVEQSDLPGYAIPESFVGSWIHTARRSVCHARNIALDRARTATIFFLDDDAEIEVSAVDVFDRHEATDDAVTVGLIDFGTPASASEPPAPSELVPTNLFRYFLESATFWDVDAVREAGGFDERIGLPLRFAAEEGAELIGRIVTATSSRVAYVPIRVARHPSISEPPPAKAESYGRGAGSLIWVSPSWWTARYVTTISLRRLGGLVRATAQRDHTKRRVIGHWLRGFASGLVSAHRLRAAPARHTQRVTHLRQTDPHRPADRSDT